MNNTTNIKNILENKINNIVKKLYNIDVNSILSIPPQKDLGDFASNVAFIISKDLQKTTQDIAHEIKDQLNENVKELIEKVEIAGPGFLNIFIKSESLFKMLLNIDNDYGTSTALHPKRIIVEMGDPNTHKAPHVGHLFSYLCGDSIARLLISQGNEIKKVTYRSDVGMGVAMCLYFWIKDGRKEPETLKDKVLLLQLCYQKGRELYEEENEKAEIIKLNSMLYEEGSTIHLDWLKTREWCLNYYKELENSLGIHSQQNYLESMVAEEGLKVVKEHIRDVFIESEGAIIFPGEKYGLHSRVFITKQGTPTYEAKDLGLVIKKMQDWPFDLTIIPTAHEQNAYFEVLIMSISKALPQYIGKIKHIGFGMVSMKTGRIRSRTGNGLNAITLIESVQKKIEILINSRDNIPENEKPDIIEKISMGAIKYAFLKIYL